MADYVIVDDILAPKGAIVLEYRGPNPFAIYLKLSGLLQVIFEGKGENFFEDEFRWDITEDPRPFFIRVHFEKGIDRFTDMHIGIKLQGKQPTDIAKPGVVFIEIGGHIRTSFPFDSLLDKLILFPFLWLYYHAIYINVKRRYIEMLKEKVEALESEIRANFAIMMRKRLT